MQLSLSNVSEVFWQPTLNSLRVATCRGETMYIGNVQIPRVNSICAESITYEEYARRMNIIRAMTDWPVVDLVMGGFGDYTHTECKYGNCLILQRHKSGYTEAQIVITFGLGKRAELLEVGEAPKEARELIRVTSA
jgi:hypothetical protein